MLIKTVLRKCLKTLNEKIAPDSDAMVIDAEFGEIYRACARYMVKTTTMINSHALYKATEYAVKKEVPGDIVECGVWKGGGAMVMAHTLVRMHDTHRKLYLYDTYAGMTEPGEHDTAIPNGTRATEKWGRNRFRDWKAISLQEVKENMRRTGYPEENLIFVQGAVEETLPSIVPKRISLLRLDTDWYGSTKHELTHLYPRLSQFGVVIIDDYGYWAGAQRATDEYFFNRPILLNRIDETVRIGVKVGG